MTLNEAINIILDGEAILFLGSGFSIGATNVNGKDFGNAGELAKKLQKECGYADDEMVKDLGRAAEIYQMDKSEHELVEYLINEFTAIETSDAQKTIASLPWQRVYTTNYDNVFELASQHSKKNYLSPVLSDNTNDYVGKGNLCVHLNGKVDGLTIEKLNGEFKLTDISYLPEDLKKSDWLSIFRTDLRTAKAVFFVGYSMNYDFDLQRTVYEGAIKDKAFFITYDEESKINLRCLEKFGMPCPIKTEGLAKLIEEVKKDYVPVGRLSPVYLCFEKIKKYSDPKAVLDKDIFDLYYSGTVIPEKLFFSLKSPDNYPYVLYRTKLDETFEKIKNGEQTILVHSDLGNGKSLFINSLESLLTDAGYEVYHYMRYRTTAEREMERICQSHDKTVLVFEDYVGCMDQLKFLSTILTDQIIIVSERTATNDANYTVLEENLGEFYHVDVNQLDAEEVSELIEIFNHYGLWQDLAAKSPSEKEDFIRLECRLRIANVVLKLLESPTIKERFKTVIDKIKKKNAYYEAIVFILVAHVSKLNLDFDDLSCALDTYKLNTPSFRKDTSVLEFIDFTDDTIKEKSSIVSEFLLKRILDSSTVVNVLIDVFKNLVYQSHDKGTRRILRKIMTFTNLQHVLNRDDKNYSVNVLSFYDTIGKYDFCRSNPHYWLQYAIVMLSQYNYQQANVYFKNAYAYAKKITDFDTYQIDNHHARFILENERLYGTKETCMKAFAEAHAVLMDPKHKIEVRHYPYRVAQNYYSFYEKFYPEMNDGEKNAFLKSCNEMLDRIAWYERNTHNIHMDVKKAKNSLTKILEETKIR